MKYKPGYEVIYEQWYDLLLDLLRRKGYSKVPDRDDAMQMYNQDKQPEEAAEAYSNKWGDPGEEEID